MELKELKEVHWGEGGESRSGSVSRASQGKSDQRMRALSILLRSSDFIPKALQSEAMVALARPRQGR